MKIPDTGKDNPYNMKIGAQIWQHKDWTLLAIGGIISADRPTPRSFGVFGLENLNLQVGDYVMVARDNSNNRKYYYRPHEKIPAINEAVEIKEGGVGRVKAIYKGRVIIDGSLAVAGTALTECWPKPGGAITKILGYNRTMIDEKKSDQVEAAKKRYGSNFIDLAYDGDYNEQID